MASVAVAGEGVMECPGTSGELVTISAMKSLSILQPFPLEARIGRELPRYCVIESRIMVMISAGRGQVWPGESSRQSSFLEKAARVMIEFDCMTSASVMHNAYLSRDQILRQERDSSLSPLVR